MDGILNINKPEGRSSFSVVSLVKKLSGERRVGHAGTLDPAASGVLPVCLGQATRIVEFLMDTAKVYRAEVEMGVVTDTYDAEGRVMRRSDPSGLDRQQLEKGLVSFRGLISQVPPMYSAVKHQGKPLYKLARVGVTVGRKSRLVRIYSLELSGWQPPLATIEVACARGTYIRALAHDLGQALGCGACLKNLVRLRCGSFGIEDAVSLPQIEAAFRGGYGQRYLHPVDSVLTHLPVMVVDDDGARDISHGKVVPGDSPLGQDARTQDRELCRAYNIDGHFLGVLRFCSVRGWWQPEKVFIQPDLLHCGAGRE